ncbi:MAG: histidine phosphatase family protein [Clostridia bacterium]|nr:histidine phosphatase family protein [Clostridia bacterium]
MTTLYLVRHGETQWNKENRCQGCIDIELNKDGLKQAKAIAQKLVQENIDIIHSSELKRAYCTADIIAESLGLGVIRSKALNEINFGDWEGLTFEEMKNKPNYSYDEWRVSPHKAAIPGEGSLKNVQDRAMDYINKIIKDNLGKNILVVSHGGVIKTIILGMLGIGLEAYNKFYIANTALSIIKIDNERTYIKTLNDTCHLRAYGVNNNG